MSEQKVRKWRQNIDNSRTLTLKRTKKISLADIREERPKHVYMAWEENWLNRKQKTEIPNCTTEWCSSAPRIISFF